MLLMCSCMRASGVQISYSLCTVDLSFVTSSQQAPAWSAESAEQLKCSTGAAAPKRSKTDADIALKISTRPHYAAYVLRSYRRPAAPSSGTAPPRRSAIESSVAQMRSTAPQPAAASSQPAWCSRQRVHRGNYRPAALPACATAELARAQRRAARPPAGNRHCSSGIWPNRP